MIKQIGDKAKELQANYLCEWRRRNPDKLRQQHPNYWERKADPFGSKVKKLSKKGFTQRAIAKELGISLGAVNTILNNT